MPWMSQIYHLDAVKLYVGFVICGSERQRNRVPLSKYANDEK
jgi:hypothetical protein